MQDIKKLRVRTSAGLGLCKEALEKSDGDMEKAVEYVNKRSDVISRLYNTTGAKIGHCKLAYKEADKNFEKAVQIIKERGWENDLAQDSEQSKEGVIGVYKHAVTNKLVGLVELNCDTDFVAKNKDFRKLAHELAMQVAANSAKYVSRDDVPDEVIEQEKKVMKEDDKLKGKPKKVLDKILKGKMEKFYKENCLLEQTYLKDDKKKISDLVNEAINTLGEKISIGRIYRMEIH